MKPQVLSVTGVGTSSSVVVNTNISPINIGVAVVVTGTVNYTVNHTYDSPGGSGFSTWFPDGTLAGKTANAETNITIPVTGLQLVVNSGTGTATMTVVQAGI